MAEDSECVHIGTPAALPLIWVLREADEEKWEAVVVALGELGDARSAEPLLTALKDGGWRGRAKPLSLRWGRSLRSQGDGRATDVIVRALDDESAKVQKAARVCLGTSAGNRVDRRPRSTAGSRRTTRTGALRPARLRW